MKFNRISAMFALVVSLMVLLASAVIILLFSTLATMLCKGSCW